MTSVISDLMVTENWHARMTLMRVRLMFVQCMNHFYSKCVICVGYVETSVFQ